MVKRLVSFTREGVQPPSRFYLRPAERLEIRAWCSTTGVTLGIHGLILTPDGTVQEISEIFEPTSNRVVTVKRFTMSEGFLLHLQVREESSVLLPGDCWITAQVVRGLAGAAVRVSTLFADYVHPLTSPTYPTSPINQPTDGQGALNSFNGSNPAAGAEISDFVPANVTWEPLTIGLTLVTAAGGAAREISLVITDGTDVILNCPVVTTIPANQTWTICFSQFGGPVRTIGTQVSVPLPHLLLQPGYNITTVTTNLAGGDDYNAPHYFMKEWLIE